MVRNYSSYKDSLHNHCWNVEIYYVRLGIRHTFGRLGLIHHQVEEPMHNVELVIDYEVLMFPVEI